MGLAPTEKALKGDILKGASYQSRFLGRGCDEALFSEKKGFSVKRERQSSEFGVW